MAKAKKTTKKTEMSEKKSKNICEIIFYIDERLIFAAYFYFHNKVVS